MSFQIKSFATIRISVTNVAESKNWYQSLFGQRPIVQIQDPFGNVIGFESAFEVTTLSTKPDA